MGGPKDRLSHVKDTELTSFEFPQWENGKLVWQKALSLTAVSSQVPCSHIQPQNGWKGEAARTM